jgi:oxygen-dependent protoporphyrinogen oxidase
VSDSGRSSDALPLAVVGGGITGLAAALRLRQLLPQHRVHLFEAAERLGGVLQTSSQAGYLVEHGADNFLADAQVLEFFRRYGLEQELAATDVRFRRALVVRGGRLHPIPDGFRLMLPGSWTALLRSSLLSWPGRLRLMAEPLVPPHRAADEESLEQFAVRRLGREAFEWIVQPLVGGIYTADPRQLSLDAALPQFRRWERQYGSLTRAAWRQRSGRGSRSAESTRAGGDSGARYSQFLGPRHGMATLVARLAGALCAEEVHLQARVERLTYRNSQWQLWFNGDQYDRRFAAVILALPVQAAARLIRPLSPPAAEALHEIPCASSVVVSLGYRRQNIRYPLTAFGIVVPAAEGRDVLAISLASVKFPGRAPEGCELIRVFLGGALQPELVDRSDQQLMAAAIRETSELLQIEGSPDYCSLVRWRETMPQYNLGHGRRIVRLESALESWPGLELAGNYFHGVGIPQCIHSGQKAADRIAAQWMGTGTAGHA